MADSSVYSDNAVESLRRKFGLIPSSVRLFALTITGLFLIFAVPFIGPYVYLRLVLGIFVYVFLIGYFLLDTILESDFETKLLMSGPTGLMIQNLFILILYNTVPFLAVKVDFELCLLLLNTFFVTMIFSLKFLRGRPALPVKGTSISGMTRFLKEPIIFIFLLGLVVRVLYQTFNTSSILSDAALYCDSAKQLVTQGRFTSNVLNDGSTNPYQLQYGLVPYIFTWFSISIFFLFGEPTFAFAKLFAVFVGAIVVFPTYMFTKKLLNKPSGLIASVIVAVHPLLNFYSVVLYGPEITSLLFSITFLYFLVCAVESNQVRHGFLAGLFASMAIFSWRWEMFFVYMASFLVFLRIRKGFKQASYWTLLTLLCFAVLDFTVFLYPIILTVLASVAIVYLRLRTKREVVPTFRIALTFLAVVGLAAQLALNRSYMLPALVVQVSREPKAIEANIRSVLFPNLQVFQDLIWRYFVSLSEYATIPLLFLASLLVTAVSKFRVVVFLWSFIIVYSVASALLIPVQLFTGTGFSFSRLLLAPTWFLSALTAFSIYVFIITSYRRKRSPKIRGDDMMHDNSRLGQSRAKVWASAFILIALTSSFYSGYVAGVYIGMKEGNFLRYPSAEEAVNWLSKNADSDSIILSFDPRTIAWFSNRTSAGLHVKDGTRWTGNIDMNDLVSLFQEFKAKYLFLPPTTPDVSTSQWLRQLYFDSPSSFYLKQLDKETLVNSSIKTISLPVLLRDFRSNDTPHSTIYEFGFSQLMTHFVFLDDEFSVGWSPARGSISNDHGEISLTTNKDENWGMYVSYTFPNGTLHIDNSTYVAVGVTEVSEKANAGIYVHFTDGTEFTQFFSKPAFLMVDLSKFEGKDVRQIYLYNLLVMKKTVGSYLVKYDFIAFLQTRLNPDRDY